jgi:type VI secretion system protein ImpK
MLAEPASSPGAPDIPGNPSRRGQLGLALQEAFTVAVRLRSDRQVAASADAFREQVKFLLSAADRDARRAGYGGGDVRLAVYAYIAFLDETVLSSTQPMFQGWNRRPLQEEVFGDHVAGETFFRNLSDLMARQDSEDLADVLEVYLLCLLLGFRGKYAGNPDGLQSLVASIQERLRRVRGPAPLVGPDWALPPGESPPSSRDPWLRRLVVTVGIVLLMAVGLFLIFHFSLRSSTTDLRELTAGLLP